MNIGVDVQEMSQHSDFSLLLSYISLSYPYRNFIHVFGEMAIFAYEFSFFIFKNM